MSVVATLTRTGFPSVNLLPPETKQRQKNRRRTSVVVVVGVAALVLVGFLYYLESNRVSDLKGQVATQTAVNATLQAQATSLQPYAQLKETLAAKQLLVNAALSGDISWSNILHELAVTIPSKAWLVSFNGTSTATDAAGSPTALGAPTTGIVGTIIFSGDTIGARTLSELLVRLQREPGWVNPWISSAQKSPAGGTPLWSFSGSVDLTNPVLSKRGRAS